jgi:hypothetical protein
MHSLEAHEIANGRTVVRHPDLCVPANGRTAGGTRGHLGLVPRGDGASAVWRWEHRRGKEKKEEDTCYGNE